MLTPRLSARIGLSRSAANARPHGERNSHHKRTISTTVKKSVNQKNGSTPSSDNPNSVGRGIPEMPNVPPVSFSSLRIIRNTSTLKPSVAKAR